MQMSIQTTNLNGQSCIASITDHARLRALQRLDVDPARVDEELRRRFREGRRASASHVTRGQARRHGDYLIVYQQTESAPVILTVLYATEEVAER